MTNANAPEPVQEEGGQTEPPPPPTSPVTPLHGGNKVYKSGPLFLSSKGIGWTSWKKRWFILTQTSLVFYRSDPNVVPQKGSEVNLTLGGIDLNSSGSVVVKEDKKLITVLFPDGRDGRAFTLKAETTEDLQGWKEALEEAISNAPSAALVVGPNGSLKHDQSNVDDASSELKERQIVKSMVIGGPILLALEDIDGTPSFLEKALRFLEEHGVKTEGILRQAADVEDVEHRIQEYEKGKTDFLPEEDAHVIADCIKYVLRELPSSPVPASCCKALLEAFRTERGIRVNAMRTAICETFPEPNRRLLQRILMMMQTVASHKAENRMSVSAVAACMAPLLLRPLLAGDCEIENDFSVGGDSSLQLMQAAAAANHAQAIVIILLEEYDNIFGDGAVSHEPYTDSDSEESGSESEEMTDSDYDDEDDDESFDEDEYTTEASGTDVDEHEHSPISTKSAENQLLNKKSPQLDNVVETGKNLPSSPLKTDDVPNLQSSELLGSQNASELSHEPVRGARGPTVWGRTPGRKNLSMESIEVSPGNEAEIQDKTNSRARISTEANENLLPQDSIERRKHDLHELRLALEKDVARLHKQLEKEMELRTSLEEVGLKISQSVVDEKMKAEIAQAEADVINLNQKADDLELQLYRQREQNSMIRHDICNKIRQNPDHKLNLKEKQMGDESLPNIPCTSENSPKSKHESNEVDKKQEYSSSSNVPLPLNQKPDVQNDIGANKQATFGSRKSTSRAAMRSRQIHNSFNLQNLDSKELSSENEQLLDKSESFSAVDKGHSKLPPRTNSR